MTTMLDMAKDEKRNKDRPGVQLGIRIDDAIASRMDALRAKHQYPPTLTAMVEDALVRYLDAEEPKFSGKSKR